MQLKNLRGIFQNRRNAYRALLTPGSVMADIVLDDLRQFCRATTTPAVVNRQSGMIDPIATGIAIGRLEVWHRIALNVNISDADLYRIINDNPGDTE